MVKTDEAGIPLCEHCGQRWGNRRAAEDHEDGCDEQ